MLHVVSRHGVPRELRSDAGSNLTSELVTTILQKTGVDLRPTEAHHHEGVGLVERAQQTLINLARATDEGGAHWVDHLPFYLMAMRASAGRITRESPAALLYGREIRLPAQINDPRPTADITVDNTLPEPLADYAYRLHTRLQAAWAAAHTATLEAQSDAVADTTRTKDVSRAFLVSDRVCRRLPGLANKLLYHYAGPYRVAEVLPAGKYRLTDLENRRIKDEVHISNLRPYFTITDLEPVQPDEYLVDSLLAVRGRGNRRQYLVKWRGYRRGESTWEPRTELMRRCGDLVKEFDQNKGPDPNKPSPSVKARTDSSSRPSAAQNSTRRPSDPIVFDQTRRRVLRSGREKYSDSATAPRQTIHALQAQTTPVPTTAGTVQPSPPLAARFERGSWTFLVATEPNPTWVPANAICSTIVLTTPYAAAQASAIADMARAKQQIAASASDLKWDCV